MPQNDSDLPEFQNPPVSEVALSVEFLPLQRWLSPYAGLYWDQISNEYPGIAVHAPLPSQIEKFGGEFWQNRATMRVALPSPDFNRVWFLSEPPTRLIQIQRDRYIVNWRKVQGNEAYPRYRDEIRPRFQKEWGRFKEFVVSRELGDIEVQQCEITYVNDIIQGQGWNSVADMPRIFSRWSDQRSGKFLPSAESVELSGSFLMPEELGRLHFAVQHLRREIDDTQVIQLRLTARGKPGSGSDADVLEWMDHGRNWIVRGFTDLTTAEMHRLWQRSR